MPMDIIDPAMKHTVKLDYVRNKLSDLRQDKRIREWMSLMMSGQSLHDIQTHPYINELSNMCEKMTTALFSLEKNVTFRPNQAKYQELKTEAKSFYTTCGRPDEIFDLHELLNDSRKKHDGKKLRDLNSRIDNLCKNVENYIESVRMRYPEYYDVISFFVLGLEQIIFGFRTMTHSLLYKKSCVVFDCEKFQNDINCFLSCVPTFATGAALSPLTTSTLLIQGHRDALTYLLALGQLPMGKHQYKLVKSSILETITELKIRGGYLEGKTGAILDNLISAFDVLVKIWTHEEAKVKHEKEKMEGLYKQKVHKTEMSEEEEINSKIAAMFPSYRKEFQDLLKSEDDTEDQPVEDDPPEDVFTFTANDLYEISQLHATAISLLFNEYDEASLGSSSQLDVVTPYLLRHDILCGLVSNYGDYLDASLDAKLLPGQLLMCNELKKPGPKDFDALFDIYKDPCPAKVSAFYPILSELADHVSQLLKEFENQPILVQILVVIRRVLSFPISAPIMKFVIGIELIIETAQVESTVAQTQRQIEKEIKDYVKICRWNDRNYYTVKQSVEKSHRFVVKHIKTFEDALKKPARQLFVLPSKEDAVSSEDPWTLSIKLEKRSNEQHQLKHFANRPEKVFQKIPKCYGKTKKIVRKMSKSFPPINHINNFNDFCGNVIEALQIASTTTGKARCTRSREKKQVLQAIQNKKQMLSTLFKNLKVMGLSYRKGKINSGDKRVTDTTTVVPPLDVLKMEILKSDESFKEMVLKSASDTDHYFFKCIAQYNHLTQLMASPCKDLTLDIIHRIEGYSSDLLCIVSTQRENISTIMKKIDKVGCFVENMKTLYEKRKSKSYLDDKVSIPSQKIFKKNKEEFIDCFVKIRTALSEFRALMECAPSKNTIPDNLNQILMEFSTDRYY
ncbi:midasin-like [Uloborus diversus]|uniref:midasin-like n=1 Tax=Uloborus diversus TaxID=327109 RepID=UPI002409E1FA|nr:midasin-like [Uloborus diversus]